MSYLLYFGLLAIQLTSILATQPLPLKCILQDNHFLTLFNKGNVRTSSDDVLAINRPPLDILKVDYLRVDRDGFVLEVKDMEVKGIEDAVLDDFGINLSNNISYLTFHTDMFAKYLYKADGSLLFLPISGEGVCNTSVKNIQVGMVIPLDIVDKNGKKYFDLKSYEYWYDVKDNANINLSNLYYGDKEKSDIMHYLINQNWKFMTVRYGTYFMDEIMLRFFNMFKNYYLSMPLRDFNTC
ncbi:unnamed protein product [Euphydryas editha]|uniref:Uncharacterized protein n=1 Tax=Euphydryas editha TaxID=104508 RepID=A0AAU9TH77_EUPED|nr:unnamed protein product [Euphydryas editha]